MLPKLFRQAVRQIVKRSYTGLGKGPKAALIVGALLCGYAVQALPPGTDDEIRSRLVSASQLCRAGDDCGTATAAAPTEPRSGEEVYNQFCFACHATGVGGAPKVGIAADWEPRISKGMDALWSTMQNGLNAMPAKGTCMNCSDDELRASMNYLVDQSQ